MFTWLINHIKPYIIKFSQIFLVSNALGKVLAGYFLNIYVQSRLILHNLNNIKTCAEIQFNNFALTFLCVGYIFFIFLSYSTKRVYRKQKIVQLSEEVKGMLK